MLGQHIFVRCRNEQNNAGTWTAAMTENVVDKDIVRNFIEPRCNMDEAFAQRTLMQNDNSVLRIYQVADDTTVVSRTYWVTDRITEAMGRKGAYSISYILTDDEQIQFSSDYAGAFDSACFESYDALVERIQQGRITINDDYSLFSHGDSGFDSSVFKTVGFTKDTFVQFMNGLYYAVEHGKQFAVVLPVEIRRAWEERGDKTMEKLAYHVMSLLPDFTRINLGIAAHWSCQIHDKMVSDMHLIFIHPEKDEELAFLKREGAMLLDLDSGKYTDKIPTVVTDYFAFLWDSLSKKENIEAFWADTKSKYRKLLRGRPNSARSMESAYLMHKVVEGGYKDKALVKRAFLLAAEEFAGAGTRVPAAEEFLAAAIDALQLQKKPLEPEFEKALCGLMVNDPDRTKHQAQEYELLLYACELGTASAETVEGLCDELDKEERIAASYFLSFLAEKKDFSASKLTLQMAQLVSGMFIRLVAQYSNGPLFNAVFDLMQQWKEELLAANAVELLKPFMDAYIRYMGSDGDNMEVRAAAYKFLFAFEHKGDAETREACAKALFREEKRLYKAESEMMDGSARIRLYAHSFFDVIPAITQMKKETAITCYQRLFRLAYKGKTEVVESALTIYRNALAAAGEGDLIDRIIPVLLQCEEDALAQIAGEPFWKRETVGCVLLMFELSNVTDLPYYAPTSKRVGELMQWYDKNNYDTYTVTTFYLRKMQLGDRQVIFTGMRENGMLENLFLHVLYGAQDADLSAAIESYLGKTHADKTKMMLESAFLAGSQYKEDSVRAIFADWYARSLENEIIALSSTEAARIFQRQNTRILEEYKLLRGSRESLLELKGIAKEILDKKAFRVFEEARAVGVVTLPAEEIGEIVRVIDGSSLEEKPVNADMFRTLERFDTTIASHDEKALDDACYEACNMYSKALLRDRLRYYMEKTENKDWLHRYWVYYLFLDMQAVGDDVQFPVNRYLHEVGREGQAEVAQGIFLLNMASYLHNWGSKFELPFEKAVLVKLAPKIRENPQNFKQPEFLNTWKTVANIPCFRSAGLSHLLHVRQNDSLRFDAPMFLLCLLSTVLTTGIAMLSFWGLVLLGRVDILVSLSVGVFAFVIFAALAFCMLPKGSNRKMRRQNRRF